MYKVQSLWREKKAEEEKGRSELAVQVQVQPWLVVVGRCEPTLNQHQLATT